MAERRDRPVGIGQLLREGPAGSALGRLAASASASLTLLETLRAALPAELREALVACSLRADGTLTLTATSPTWAARLRYEAPGLLALCRQDHAAAARTRVRVARRLDGLQAGP